MYDVGIKMSTNKKESRCARLYSLTITYAMEKLDIFFKVFMMLIAFLNYIKGGGKSNKDP